MIWCLVSADYTITFMVHLSDALYFTVGDRWNPYNLMGAGGGEEVKLLQGRQWTGLFLEKVPNPHYSLTMWLSREVEMCLLMKYGAPEKKWAWMLQDLPRTSSVMRHMTFRCGCFDTDCPLGNVETWRQKQKG